MEILALIIIIIGIRGLIMEKRRMKEVETNRPARRALHIRLLERATGMDK
jgi:hypothetical protein